MDKVNEVGILLADYQYLTRAGLKLLIEKVPGVYLKQEVAHPIQFQLELQALNPDMVILDVNNSEQLKSLPFIQQKVTDRLLVLNQHAEAIPTLMKSGIKGIISKTCGEDEIITAIQAVACKKRYFCGSTLNVFYQQNQNEHDIKEELLSPRELQVIQLMASGYTTQRIAEVLNISVHTVNSHRKNMLKKLKISSPMQLIAYAVEQGLVKVNFPEKR
jgi:two-component system, NarL family, response regulator NreC